MTYRLVLLIASLDSYLRTVPRGDCRGPHVVDAIAALEAAAKASRHGFDSSGKYGYL